MVNAATLSVCMIVKNEASLLGRCLQSVASVADEIIVVDTGSTDATIETAKKFGAVVVCDPWRNDFSYARNISLDHATSAWVLWLDADDVVPQSSLPVIGHLKTLSPDKVFGFIVRNERPGNTGTEFIQARMFPNDPRIRFERKIHEQMMPCALRIGLKLEMTEAVVEHHGYAEPSVLKVKAQRNLSLLLDEYHAHGSDTVTALEIGDSYQLTEAFDKAEEWYLKVLDFPECRTKTPALAGQALLGLGSIANRSAHYESAIRYLSEALELSPWRPDIHYSLAVARELSGDIPGAIDHLRTVLITQDQPGQVGVDFRASKIKAYLRLTRLLTEQEMVPDALDTLFQALEMFPSRPELHMMNGKVLLKAGKVIDALRAFEKSILIQRKNNLDSYIGLCIIYRRAGAEPKVKETLDAIAPLFDGIEKYSVFRTYFMAETVDNVSVDDSPAKKCYEQIRREFFYMVEL
jgi:tetratricopeptide (TPR) repeat protein